MISMIFETLYESAKRGELMLVEGGLCHWYLRLDFQITIREIISTRPGAGGEMLRRLIVIGEELGANSIFAKCPIDLPANAWYEKMGFLNVGTETTGTGRKLLLWRLPLHLTYPMGFIAARTAAGMHQ